MLCIDNSEWSRNGDYAPSRFDAQRETINFAGRQPRSRATPRPPSASSPSPATALRSTSPPPATPGQIMTALAKDVQHRQRDSANFLSGHQDGRPGAEEPAEQEPAPAHRPLRGQPRARRRAGADPRGQGAEEEQHRRGRHQLRRGERGERERGEVGAVHRGRQRVGQQPPRQRPSLARTYSATWCSARAIMAGGGQEEAQAANAAAGAWERAAGRAATPLADIDPNHGPRDGDGHPHEHGGGEGPTAAPIAQDTAGSGRVCVTAYSRRTAATAAIRGLRRLRRPRQTTWCPWRTTRRRCCSRQSPCPCSCHRSHTQTHTHAKHPSFPHAQRRLIPLLPRPLCSAHRRQRPRSLCDHRCCGCGRLCKRRSGPTRPQQCGHRRRHAGPGLHQFPPRLSHGLCHHGRGCQPPHCSSPIPPHAPHSALADR